MKESVKVGNLNVARILYQFIQDEALPGSGVEPEQFWSGLERIVTDLMPWNKALLKRRDELQSAINEWHAKQNGQYDGISYKFFLREIGYLEGEVEEFTIATSNVDPEIRMQAGPQLVVPLSNARYALNAANARWGSLYDALYGTDAIDEGGGADRSEKYNPVRGNKVVDFAKQFLDQAAPLNRGSHKDVVKYTVSNGALVVMLQNGERSELKEAEKLVGYQGQPDEPDAVLIKNNGLHIELQIDRRHLIGQTDPAGVKDIIMEAALSVIMDCEDSVAAVDAEDKVLLYRNWLGLIKGNLEAVFTKEGKEVARRLNPDRCYTSPTGDEFLLKGRSMMLIRNVGHLTENEAVVTSEGEQIPEGILDAAITSLIAKHDLLKVREQYNTTEGSIYIVKPKMHGSEEAAFANELFNRVEDILNLERHTLKIGVMDEERRTSLNLKACLREVKNRVIFINTGFLDRTGDEIHTSMEAGPMIRKQEMKASNWLQAYEKSNVYVGLNCGLSGRAQIGKGMWAMPDLMADMLKQKISHVEAGANTAWVPSPTAAVLHAIHYHSVNVWEVQDKLKVEAHDLSDEILQIPIAHETTWSAEEIQQELDNNAQGILGYVVRWVEQGIGCSKVPDIHNVGLMEDRATLRISSQHMANWLHHGICTQTQVMETLHRMARVVDEQNEGSPGYRPMSENFESSPGFQAACELVFQGIHQPNGYTEPILHRHRLEAKKNRY